MDAYQDLAAEVLRACSGDVMEVRLRAELDEGYSDFDILCVKDDHENSQGQMTPQSQWKIHRLLSQIREEMHGLSGQSWNRCIFTVTASGSFKLDVEY